MRHRKRLRRMMTCIVVASTMLFPACATATAGQKAVAPTKVPAANVNDTGRLEDIVLVHALSQEEFEGMFGTPSYTTFPAPEKEILPVVPESIGDAFTVTDVPVIQEETSVMAGVDEVEMRDDETGWTVLPPDEAESITVSEDIMIDDAGDDTPIITILPEGDGVEVRIVPDKGYEPSVSEDVDVPATVSADKILILSDAPEGTQLPAYVTETEAPAETAPISVVTIHEPGQVVTERYEPSLDSIFAVHDSAPEPTRFSLQAFLENNTLLTAVGTVVFAFIMLASIAGRIGGKPSERKRPEPVYPVQEEETDMPEDGGTVELMPGKPETATAATKVMDIRPEEQHYSTLAVMRMQKAEAGAPETAEAV